MEDVSAVDVDVDPIEVSGVGVAPDMISPIDHEDLLPSAFARLANVAP